MKHLDSFLQKKVVFKILDIQGTLDLMRQDVFKGDMHVQNTCMTHFNETGKIHCFQSRINQGLVKLRVHCCSNIDVAAALYLGGSSTSNTN